MRICDTLHLLQNIFLEQNKDTKKTRTKGLHLGTIYYDILPQKEVLNGTQHCSN